MIDAVVNIVAAFIGITFIASSIFICGWCWAQMFLMVRSTIREWRDGT